MSTREALYLSHGGGPLPLLNDQAHAEMVACLRDIAAEITRPSAIIIVSAHWERPCATVTTAETSTLIYDYHGFPEASYAITYPCPTATNLAREVVKCLRHSGINVATDDQRGFDHGVFVPMKVMYPDASIPCMQLSLLNHLDPESHIQLGEALRRLADQSFLLVGSGFSFHNLRAFFSVPTAESQAANAAFEQWLIATCSDSAISEDERRQRLCAWSSAPAAAYCHPRSEHLLPLHVCYGYAGAASTSLHQVTVMNKQASMYHWQVASSES